MLFEDGLVLGDGLFQNLQRYEKRRVFDVLAEAFEADVVVVHVEALFADAQELEGVGGVPGAGGEGG